MIYHICNLEIPRLFDAVQCDGKICKGCYHKDCWNEWMDISKTCPICRANEQSKATNWLAKALNVLDFTGKLFLSFLFFCIALGFYIENQFRIKDATGCATFSSYLGERQARSLRYYFCQLLSYFVPFEIDAKLLELIRMHRYFMTFCNLLWTFQYIGFIAFLCMIFVKFVKFKK